MRTRSRILFLLSTIAVGVLSTTSAIGQVAPDNVSAAGMAGYQLLYGFDEVPSAAAFSDGVGWDVDNSDTPLAGVADRIGVYYQLDDDWVWASIPAYTQDLKQMGFPEFNTNPFFFQQVLPNLVVETNSDFVESGTFDQANIEIWPTNYGWENGQELPFANPEGFDFDDVRVTEGSYGSFQIHNVDEAETVFAINRFNQGDNYDTTIGNFEGGHADGTFNQAASGFFDRIFEIYVKPFDGSVADLNSDGAVDTADLQVFASNLNETGTIRETGDLNGDFQTDLHDFAIFREAFNAPVGAPSASIPEPTGLTLAFLSMLGVLSIRRRQSR